MHRILLCNACYGVPKKPYSKRYCLFHAASVLVSVTITCFGIGTRNFDTSRKFSLLHWCRKFGKVTFGMVVSLIAFYCCFKFIAVIACLLYLMQLWRWTCESDMNISVLLRTSPSLVGKKKQKSFTSPVTKKKSFENHNLDTEKQTSFHKEMNAEFIYVNSKSFS